MVDEKKKYEMAVLLKSSLELGEAEAHFGSIIKAVRDGGADIESEHAAANRIHLAYPIQKEPEAYFSFFYFSAMPDVIKPLKEQFNLDKNIVRFMIILRQKLEGRDPRRKPTQTAELPPATTLDNEELEQKLKEILQ